MRQLIEIPSGVYTVETFAKIPGMLGVVVELKDHGLFTLHDSCMETIEGVGEYDTLLLYLTHIPKGRDLVLSKVILKVLDNKGGTQLV